MKSARRMYLTGVIILTAGLPTRQGQVGGERVFRSRGLSYKSNEAPKPAARNAIKPKERSSWSSSVAVYCSQAGARSPSLNSSSNYNRLPASVYTPNAPRKRASNLHLKCSKMSLDRGTEILETLRVEGWGYRWRCKKKVRVQECELEEGNSGRHRYPTSCPRI